MANDRVVDVIAQLEDFTSGLVLKLTLDVVANLRLPESEGGTPVDTGWARANWIANIGGEYVENLDSVEPSASGALTKTAVQQASLGTIVANYELSDGPIFISNNVPYILYLNDGTKYMAPRAFVERAIVKATINDPTLNAPLDFEI